MDLINSEKFKIMVNAFYVSTPSMENLENEDLRNITGGELTRKEEIWLERGIAYLLLGIPGVLIYELGRQNG